MRFVHPAGPDQLHKVEVVHLSALRRDSPVSHKEKTKDGAELLILLAFHKSGTNSGLKLLKWLDG